MLTRYTFAYNKIAVSSNFRDACVSMYQIFVKILSLDRLNIYKYIGVVLSLLSESWIIAL